MWLKIIRCINCLTNECIVNYLLAFCPGTLLRILLILVRRYVGSKKWKYWTAFRERANLWGSPNLRWYQYSFLNYYAKTINASWLLIFRCSRSRRCVDLLWPKRWISLCVLCFISNLNLTLVFILKDGVQRLMILGFNIAKSTSGPLRDSISFSRITHLIQHI